MGPLSDTLDEVVSILTRACVIIYEKQTQKKPLPELQENIF